MKKDIRYENFIIFLAPFINSLGGIAIDLYAPSLPSIGAEFSASPSMMQYTITITLVFYAIGQIFFGVMADAIGRKSAVVLGLSIFIGGSVLATTSSSIGMLLCARALQGFSIGACQVVARALLVDNIKGTRFVIAITYLSLAFGLGPVISPYIGGLIEDNFGWRYNFVLYAAYGIVILCLVLWKLKESLPTSERRKVTDIISGFKPILFDSCFMTAVLVLGSSFSAFLLWNVVGPYIIQNTLNQSAQYFGTTALFVGLAYLTGTLSNRFLISHFQSNKLMIFGGGVFLLGIVVIAMSPKEVSLIHLLGGIIIIAFSQGLIFSNALSVSMSLFKDRAGAAASLQGCLMIAFGAVVTGVVSSLNINTNTSIASVFFFLFIIYCISMLHLNKTHFQGAKGEF
ncbi:multidrug effflux MFS transporter [Psychrobacter sp. PAMC 21119]|uniref:multidrug effflux MFS transporter n=1 Tax=Psychrobacter sp. PAMC 21119 TaxID=1112209 RepID=UPI00028A0BC9|nr:multidrug effflux MFS transporter [Psychrobacter sp. PAMC 21119]